VKIRSFKAVFKKSDQKIYKCNTHEDCISIMLYFSKFQNLVFNHPNSSEKKIVEVQSIGIDLDEHIFEDESNTIYSKLVPTTDPIISNINLIINSEIGKFTDQIKDVMDIISELEIKTRNELIKIKT